MLNRLLYVVFLSILGTLIVHIVTILLLPYYMSEEGSLRRLEREAPAYQFATLSEEHSLAAGFDPAFLVRFCYFDLSLGPVAIKADGLVPFWSLSLYDQEGSTIYSLNSATVVSNTLDLVIGDAIGIMDYRQAIGHDTGNSILSEHEIEEGFVLLRVLVPSADWALAAEAFLQSATCRQID